MQINIAAMLRWKVLLLVNALIIVCKSAKIVQVGNRKKHVLNYHGKDWMPHFGYNIGHYAYEHVHRSTTVKGDHEKASLDDYVVRIIVGGKVVCNGIIVNKNEVLTVSTCLMDAPLPSISLKLLDGSIHNATSNRPASGYTTKEAEQLLTLIKLGAELTDQFSKPPPICPHHVKVTDPVQLWVWNRRKTHLVKRRVAQLMDDDCKGKIQDTNGLVIKNYTSCIVNTQTSKKCMRSFGLPYVHEESFCGINILGHNCPRASIADVYVRLLDEKRFISEKLNLVRLSGIDKEIF